MRAERTAVGVGSGESIQVIPSQYYWSERPDLSAPLQPHNAPILPPTHLTALHQGLHHHHHVYHVYQDNLSPLPSISCTDRNSSHTLQHSECGLSPLYTYVGGFQLTSFHSVLLRSLAWRTSSWQLGGPGGHMTDTPWHSIQLLAGGAGPSQGWPHDCLQHPIKFSTFNVYLFSSVFGDIYWILSIKSLTPAQPRVPGSTVIIRNVSPFFLLFRHANSIGL